jgi:hypothetical protein
MENFGLFTYGHLVYNMAIWKFICNLVYFETQNLNFEKFCSFEMENFGLQILCVEYTYYGHSVYFVAIWKLSDNLVYFPLFWYVYCIKKNLATRFPTDIFFKKCTHVSIGLIGESRRKGISLLDAIYLRVQSRVARFFLVQYTKAWKTIQNDYKITKMPIKYSQ